MRGVVTERRTPHQAPSALASKNALRIMLAGALITADTFRLGTVAGIRVQGSECWVQGSFRVLGSGFWVRGSGFWVLGPGVALERGARSQTPEPELGTGTLNPHA